MLRKASFEVTIWLDLLQSTLYTKFKTNNEYFVIDTLESFHNWMYKNRREDCNVFTLQNKKSLPTSVRRLPFILCRSVYEF